MARAAEALHWDAQPIALVEGKRQTVRAVTAAAARLHVKTGMTVSQARSRCASLIVLPWDERVIARELARASAAFLAASPQVTPVADAPGTWWIGASGFDELGGERMLALTLQRLAQVWHPSARVGVADSCVAARAATWGVLSASARIGRVAHPPSQSSRSSGVRPEYPPSQSSRTPAASCGRFAAEDIPASLTGLKIIPPGGCATYLSGAPLALVPMDTELRETFIALGLRTAGALAALDAGDVERRWGAEGLAAWRLSRGDDDRRPVLARTDSSRFVSTELAMSTATMEPVLFLVRAALGQLVDALVRDGRAAAGIAITLTLDDGRGAQGTATPHTVTREVRPPRPIARVAPLFERCRALLDKWPLTAPVCAVTVTVSATAPMGAEQGDLLAAAWRDPAAADAAFERLRSSLGAGTIVRPVQRDEHRIEKAGAWAELFASDQERAVAPSQQSGRRTAERSESFAKKGSPPERPGTESFAKEDHRSDRPDNSTRILEQAEPVDVETAHGTPKTLGWRGRRVRISAAHGPERVSGDWWKDPFARDYWRCESDELARDFLLYRDEKGWSLQGWLD